MGTVETVNAITPNRAIGRIIISGICPLTTRRKPRRAAARISPSASNGTNTNAHHNVDPIVFGARLGNMIYINAATLARTIELRSTRLFAHLNTPFR
jgi:hypothetical protein